MTADAQSRTGHRVLAEFGCAATLITIFLAVVVWFDVVDFYDRHFFDRGIIVFADNLARSGFVFILAWLIYAPGAAVVTFFFGRSDGTRATAIERATLAFGFGVGLWHVLLLILGVAGLYYRFVMFILAAGVAFASSRHFGRLVSGAICAPTMRRAERRSILP
jgi:hypothetical protein